jgi:hypothetical protein
MSVMSAYKVWAEMARRKVQFHKNEHWNDIRLWGLFGWGDVSRFLKSGELITDMKKYHKTIWVTPSKECWEKNIKPLIEKYSLEQLTSMAGW